MDVPFLLSKAQMRRIEPFFPLSHGIPRVDDRRIVSGIIYVIKHGLMWRDAPKGYGPHKTIYNRFILWSKMGVFNRIFAALAGEAGEADTIMIEATHLKAHRTAASLLKVGLFPAVSEAPRADLTPSSMLSAMARAGRSSCCGVLETSLYHCDVGGAQTARWKINRIRQSSETPLSNRAARITLSCNSPDAR